MSSPFRELSLQQINAISAKNRASRVHRLGDEARAVQPPSDAMAVPLNANKWHVRADSSLSFELPWPPSVNHYWLSARSGQRYISAEGQSFRRAVAVKAREMFRAGDIQPTGRLAVQVLCYPPDSRKRDLDNIGKSLLDALQHAGLIRDDADIDDLRFIRVRQERGGKVEIEVTSI